MILGNPELNLRRSPLSMRKHFKKTCSCVHAQLVVCINTRNLTLSVQHTKRVVSTTWNSSRKRFTLREEVFLLGIVHDLVLNAQWAKHTCITLQHAISIVLKFNSNVVFSSDKNHLTDLLRSKHNNIRRFYLSKAHKKC